MMKFLICCTVILMLGGISLSGAENEKKALWIDVRTAEEFSQGHLKEAVNIPHDEIARRIQEVTDDREADIRLYCRSGGRAGRAKSALEKLGFKNVVNEGGYADLVKKGEPKKQ